MKLPRTAVAFTLVEVTLALGVAAFCLTTIFGLLPVGLNSNQASSEQTVSSSIAKAVMADLRATPSGAQYSPRFGFNVPASGTVAASTPQTIFLRQDTSSTPGETVANANPAGTRYRVSVAFYTQSTANQRTATGVRILVTWPALADPVTTAWPVHFSGSCEVLTALDRN
jgi:uncharacterized protein (TIGR02598 family)